MKLKVGKDLNSDIEVLQAIRVAHPHCLFILDANEGYSSSEAIQVLEKLHGKLIFKRYKIMLPIILHLYKFSFYLNKQVILTYIPII